METATAADTGSDAAPDLAVHYSLDGTRALRVDANRDAWLSDTADQPAFETFVLASNVQLAAFGTENGRIKIAVYSDTVQCFDGDGNPWDSSALSQSADAIPTTESVEKGIGASASFKALSAGVNW